jgi:hypothetical protein
MISRLLNSFFIGVLFVDFIERRFPLEFKIYKDHLINMSCTFTYNCIFYYSKLQILVINIKNKLNIFIDSNPSLTKLKHEINDYFKNNELEKNNTDNCYGYNFFIQNYPDNNLVNRQIFYKDSNNPINESSDIKFILVEFNFRDKSHKIDLKTDIFNYYLVGNKFTKDFFIYYIKKHYNINETINNDEKCSIKIIDHNVNQIELEFTDKNESILLEKNGYKLSITNHTEEKK